MSDKPDLPPEAPERDGGLDRTVGPEEAPAGPDAEGGGPPDSLPTRQDRSGLEPPISTDEEPPGGAAELDRR